MLTLATIVSIGSTSGCNTKTSKVQQEVRAAQQALQRQSVFIGVDENNHHLVFRPPFKTTDAQLAQMVPHI